MRKLTATITAICLWAVILASPMLTAGCSGTTVAQNIVDWTPDVISAVNTLDSVAFGLQPADALIITAVTSGFDAAANLVEQQAKTYLANPSLSTLAQLQAQVLAFQTNVNAALLAALKVSNSASQKQILQAIQAVATGLTAILALITTIKGNTLSAAAVTAPVKVSQLERITDRNQTVAQVAAHYGEPEFIASMQVSWAEQRLAQAGL